MKTELRISDHVILDGQKVVEIWWGAQLIGQITGADKPGIRLISKYAIKPIEDTKLDHHSIHLLELEIG